MALIDLDFLLRSVQNCKKMHYFDNLRIITQEGNMETRQMIPFPLELWITCIFVFENSQNSFSCCSPFGPFWSLKYLSFGKKLPIRTTHHTFIESRHPDTTKNRCYVLYPMGSQKKVSADRLFLFHLKIHPYFKKSMSQM